MGKLDVQIKLGDDEMKEVIAEALLAEIERWADEGRLQGLSLPDALLLLAEVRRLREVNERLEKLVEELFR